MNRKVNLLGSLKFDLEVVTGPKLGISRWAPWVAWAYGLLMIAIKLSEVRISFGFLGPFGYWLDGLQSHDWHQSLSLLCLRLISFNMDYYWTLKELKDTKVDDAQAKVTSEPSGLYKTREQQPRDLEEYNITNCLAYCFYSPLWLAGPTTTFNAFTSHIRDRSQEAVVGWKLFVYAARLLFCFVLLEVMLHSCPVWAIGRSSLYLKVQRPDLLASYAMMMLIAMWLKFLIIWRFARLWALCDGIEVVENMQRCVCNNYCITSFWRGWHVSFNRWLIRYLYVPLGGRKYRLVNVWLVFGFVALWHDAELKLLAWGMLNALFMVGESLAACVWRSKVFSSLRALPEASRWVRAAAVQYMMSQLCLRPVLREPHRLRLGSWGNRLFGAARLFGRLGTVPGDVGLHCHLSLRCGPGDAGTS
eukprot:s3831_g15.t1